MSESVLARVPVEYPDSDGQPMAENDWQLHAMIDAIAALDVYFRHRPDVYVSGDLLIYHEEGNPGARVAPDVLVVLGAAKQTYKRWEEPKAPDFVMEVASRRLGGGMRRASARSMRSWGCGNTGSSTRGGTFCRRCFKVFACTRASISPCRPGGWTARGSCPARCWGLTCGWRGAGFVFAIRCPERTFARVRRRRPHGANRPRPGVSRRSGSLRRRGTPGRRGARLGAPGSSRRGNGKVGALAVRAERPVTRIPSRYHSRLTHGL